MAHNKGNTIIHGVYCSRYCKLFDRNNLKMINGAEKHGNKQYEGFNYWPQITVSCDTCSSDVILTHSKEGDDRAFCSRACHIKVKTCRKNALKDYNILKILREHPDGLPSDELSYMVGTTNQYRTNPSKIASMLKFWVAKGVVSKKLSKGSTGKTIYSLSKTYLNKPLGKTVVDYKGRKTYAERLEVIQ
jgi:hypothetical protein